MPQRSTNRGTESTGKHTLDARWRVLLPEQFLPLGNTTPDLHQVAEMLVRIYKSAMRSWTVTRPAGCKDLVLAKSYDDVLHARCAKRNDVEGDESCQDRISIAGSIRRAYIAAQVISTSAGEKFYPRLAPGDVKRGGHATRFQDATFGATGTGGGWSTAWG